MSDLALYNKLISLPEDLRAQALEFIDSLLQKKKAKVQISQEPLSEDPIIENPKPFRFEDAHFLECQEMLKDVKGTPLSELLIEERRTTG